MGSADYTSASTGPTRPETRRGQKFSMVSSLQRIPTDGSRFTGFRLAEIVGDGSG